MNKNKTKKQRMILVSVLIVCCLIAVGGIYQVLQSEAIDTVESNAVVDEVPEVSTIENEAIEVEEIIVDIVQAEVNVTPIKDDEKDEPEAIKEVEVVIDEPKPDEPKKPQNTSPEVVPETKDDVTDMSVEPEYEEDQVTYTEEVIDESTVEPVEEKDDKEDSNLVPESENPFANPDNVANPDVQNGDELYENGVPAGQGDKF